MKSYIPYIVLLGCISLTACKALVKEGNYIQPVKQYIDYTEKLNNASNKELAREYSHVLSTYSRNHEVDKRIYLALILSRPDHPRTDLEDARSHFLAILNDENAPTESVKKFIENELNHVIALIQAKNLYQEQLTKVERLEKEMSDLDEENQSLMDQKDKLEQQLEEANEKLRALTDIEQDLNQSP